MPLCFSTLDQGFAQLRVVEVGEGIDEIEYAVRAAAILPGQPAAGRAAEKGPRGDARQLASLGNSQRLFHEPAHLPVAQRPIRQRSDQSADRRHQIQTGHDPVGEAQAVGAQVGGLGFHHQLGDVDAGGAFQAATVAMNAQVGHLLEVVGRQAAQIDAVVENAADQVRLGSRRSLFGGQETEDGAHPHLRRLRTAFAAAVARRRGVRHALRVPVDLQFHEVAKRRAVRAPRPASRLQAAAAAAADANCASSVPHRR